MSKKKKTKLIHKEKEVISEMSAEPVREAKEETSEGKRNLKDIADGIIASYEVRARVVGGIIDDTHKMMDDFKEKREIMTGELQKILAKCESLRKKDFDRMMTDIVARQNEREKEVRMMLENFRKEEEMVVEKLKMLLKKGEDIRIKDFKKMMLNIRQEQEKRARETSASVTGELDGMRQEVHTMLDNFKQERQSVAVAWHEMLGLFRREKRSDDRSEVQHRNPVSGVGSPANSVLEQVRYGAGPGNPERDGEEKNISDVTFRDVA